MRRLCHHAQGVDGSLQGTRSAGEQEGKGRGTQVGSNIKESGNKCCKVTNRSLVETFPRKGQLDLVCHCKGQTQCTLKSPSFLII